MKIAQIIYTGFGGLGNVAFSLISADKARAHDWAIGFIGDQPIDPSYPERCAEYGVGWGEFRSIAGRPYCAWMRLARWLDHKRPDVILLHSINSILPSFWSAWRRRALLVAVEHTSNSVKSRTEWLASRLSMLLADRVVVLTPEYRDELAQAHGRLFQPRKVVVIPNGIDTSMFRPPSTPKRMIRRVRLGMAARFSFSKRQELLVEMMAVLRKKRPDLSWHLALAGDGDRYKDVKDLIFARNLSDIVRLDGRLTEGGVASWMRDLDIYVHASDGEGLSTSLLQAMATGLPIIASDVPGIRNLLDSGDALGICVANDAAAFAKAICECVENWAQWESRARRAREVCCERYSHSAMLNKYVALAREGQKSAA